MHNVHVAMDNHLILEEIWRGSEEPASAGAGAQGGQVPPPSSWKKPLLFVPLRLGLTELSPSLREWTLSLGKGTIRSILLEKSCAEKKEDFF